MKKYEKKYEDVFKNTRSFKTFQADRINIDDFGFDEYVTKLKKIHRDYHITLFDHWLKLDWMLNKFSYNDKRRKNSGNHGWDYARGYYLFLRNMVGIEPIFLKRGTQACYQISTYFEEFFGDMKDSPFETEYKFPYDNLTLDYLIYVYQMDERIELLEEADKNKTELVDFYDHVINYTSCINEELGKEKYQLLRSNSYMPYIINNR